MKIGKVIFGTVDARQYAALRIVFGSLATLTLIDLLPYAPTFFSEQGWLPLRTLERIGQSPGWSFLQQIPSADGVAWFTRISVAFALAFTLGIATRLSAILTFFCLTSLYFRNPLITNGGDIFLRVMLFYLCLAPSGRAWSVDAWVRRMRRGSYSEWTRRAENGAGLRELCACPETLAVPAWPLLLIQAQVAVLYGVTGLIKLHGKDWVDGDALAFALNNPVYRRFDLTDFYATGLGHALVALGTWATLAWELSFPFLILNRKTRWIAIMLGIFIHGGILLTMQIHWFGFAMIASYLAFPRSEWFVWWERKGSLALRRRGFTLRFDQKSRLGGLAAFAVAQLPFARALRFSAGSQSARENELSLHARQIQT